MSMFRGAENMEKLVDESIKHWNNEVIGGKQRVWNVNITLGMFQGDGLYQLLFVLAIILLNLILVRIPSVTTMRVPS